MIVPAVNKIIKPGVTPVIPYHGPGIAIDPRNISGLDAWFDGSDDDTITVETGVSQWSDKSGNGRHLTQILTAKQPGRLDTRRLFFNGTTMFLEKTGFNFLNNLNSYTIIALSSTLAVGTQQEVVSIVDSLSQHGAIFGYFPTSEFRFNHRFPYGLAGGDVVFTTGTPIISGQPQVIIARRDAVAPKQSIFVDGAEDFIVPVDPAFDNTNNDLIVGALTPAAGRWLSGYIYQLLFYSRALTPSEITDLTTFLNAKK